MCLLEKAEKYIGAIKYNNVQYNTLLSTFMTDHLPCELYPTKTPKKSDSINYISQTRIAEQGD